MKICVTCKEEFEWEAFGWHGGEEEFCSVFCLPEGVLDEPYAMDYVGLTESYQDLESQLPMKSYVDQQEMLKELDPFIIQLEEYNFGDLEGSFYKKMLRELFGKFFGLQEKIESCFLKKEQLLIDYGFFISWESISMEISEEVVIELQVLLQKQLDGFEDQPTILYNQKLDALSESQNILYFDENNWSFIEDGIHPNIEHLYDVSKDFFAPILMDNTDGMFYYVELARCPKCGIMEPWEDFRYKDYYNILGCWSC